jgi:transposase
MEKNLPRKLDNTEILRQLATEQLVEMIIEQGKSIEKLRNRVVELEKEIEKLKVSRDLDSIRLWKPLSGDILKKPITNNKRNQKKTRHQNRNQKDNQGIGEKRERGLVE